MYKPKVHLRNVYPCLRWIHLLNYVTLQGSANYGNVGTRKDNH